MWHKYCHTSPIDSFQIILAYGVHMAFEGHICVWHIFCSKMVYKCCSLLNFGGCVCNGGFLHKIFKCHLHFAMSTCVGFGRGNINADWSVLS